MSTPKTHRMKLACFECGKAREDRWFYPILVDVPYGQTYRDTPCPHCGTKNLISLNSYHMNPYVGTPYRAEPYS